MSSAFCGSMTSAGATFPLSVGGTSDERNVLVE
jgi:hypothetical protein